MKVGDLQLETLESRLNPHLFKNILNSIQSHAYQTYFAMDKLANVLDYILYESRKKRLSAKTKNPVPEKPKKQIDLGFDGMLGISYGSKTLGINVGGPSLKFRINTFKIGIGAFPSLIIVDEKAMPRLAVSPIVEYRNLMLITPYYGYDSKDGQIWTFGLGYKFF